MELLRLRRSLIAEGLIANQYHREPTVLIESLGLSQGAPRWITESISDHVFGSSQAVGKAPQMVQSSPCIDHSEADPSRLSATVIADLVLGLEVAEILGVPFMCIVGAGEEIRIVPGGCKDQDRWKRTAAVVVDTLNSLNPRVEALVINTEDEKVWEALEDQVSADRSLISTRDLGGLYRLDDDSKFPEGSRFTFYFEYYRFNVSHYRSGFLSRVASRSFESFLVVENLQQAKAIQLASRLNFGCQTHHLVTVPSPSPNGEVRDTRSGSGMLTLDHFRSGHWPDMCSDSFKYWMSIKSLVDKRLTRRCSKT